MGNITLYGGYMNNCRTESPIELLGFALFKYLLGALVCSI